MEADRIRHRRALWASFVGTGIEFYDFYVYATAAVLVFPHLFFPAGNETDGGISPTSRIATFAAADNPAIYWTPEHGAFVVRGAMNAAWAKLGGATGKLGAPTADQAVNGDVVSQKFTGGTVSYNNATKVFTTDPPDLAANLAGVEVPSDPATLINQAWRAAGGLLPPRRSLVEDPAYAQAIGEQIVAQVSQLESMTVISLDMASNLVQVGMAVLEAVDYAITQHADIAPLLQEAQRRAEQAFGP